MQVFLAENAGFCWGVKRVVNLTNEIIDKGQKTIFTYGPLIHNQSVIERLTKKGVCVLPENFSDKIDDNAVVIIRAHGIPPEEKEKLRKTDVKIVDGTCPHVVKIQKEVKKAYESNRAVIILGDKGHAEVVGLMGFCPENCFVVSNETDLKKIHSTLPVTVVAQSTLDEETYDKISKLIKNKFKEEKIIDTRCDATTRRQEDAINLCKKVDMVIVIGGRNSANTNRLAKICNDENVITLHIETAKELESVDFTGIEKIGITAGASTPDWIIEEVVETVKQNNKTQKGNCKSIL